MKLKSYFVAFGVNNDIVLANKADTPHLPEHLGQIWGSVSYTFWMKYKVIQQRVPH